MGQFYDVAGDLESLELFEKPTRAMWA